MTFTHRGQFLHAAKNQTSCLVFAYGSLLWKRPFTASTQRATLHGFHRRFCTRSVLYRGTPERPGLVLGLAEGQRCDGLVLHIPGKDIETTMHHIWHREMANQAYSAELHPVQLSSGHTAPAFCFIARPYLAAYHHLADEEAISSIIAKAHGSGGSNLEYAINTHHHLNTLAIVDTHIATVVKLSQRLSQEKNDAEHTYVDT